MSKPNNNDELDSLIWYFFRDCDGQAIKDADLVAAAGRRRRIDSRILAMRQAGRIRYHHPARRPAHVRTHGWEVLGCPGDGYHEDGRWDWREGCSDCTRRTSPDPADGVVEPPPIIVFECELRIAPLPARFDF